MGSIGSIELFRFDRLARYIQDSLQARPEPSIGFFFTSRRSTEILWHLIVACSISPAQSFAPQENDRMTIEISTGSRKFRDVPISEQDEGDRTSDAILAQAAEFDDIVP
jgi:hypothetical protein